LILTTFEQWKSWVIHYSAIPYIQKFAINVDRVLSWERVWQLSAADGGFILESGKIGRYSFVGWRPGSSIKGKGSEALVSSAQGTKRLHGPPLELVEKWMKPFRSPKVDGAPKFAGGCVGYWSYDMVRSIEKIPALAADDLPYPDYYFMMFNELWVIDHEQKNLFCTVHTLFDEEKPSEAQLRELYDRATQRAEQMKSAWDYIADIENEDDAKRKKERYIEIIESDKLQVDVEAIAGIETKFSKESYMAAVRKIQNYIRQGDVFQVNLSVRQSKSLDCRPSDIYEWLRIFNPSPYMGYLQFPEFQIVSASPELLVKLDNRRVSTRPIAGTRPRGLNEHEDRRLAAELIDNEKERAEHVMLVDLERNDLGRISRYGTVKVDDFMVIEQYSHVMHIVSEVSGELAEGKDAFDVIEAVFPGGTITGAPKIRTMEIIDELEPTRRGPYTGSIGWIDYNGNMEFNIVIRTLLVSEGVGHIQAGAGIVIDSDPEKEYYESLNKAKALWKAILYSEQMNGIKVGKR
jgi:para-aminobenzoate synthetase component 1